MIFREYRRNGFVLENVDRTRSLVHILPQFATLLFADLYYGRLSIPWIGNLPSRTFVERR